MLQSNHMLQNRYRIRRRIGGGGMGTVYLSDDGRLQGRQCAIKEMLVTNLTPQAQNWSVEAFCREAEMLARLNHPGLTAVTDFFAEQGNWYLVMDYVKGVTLKARLAESPGRRLPLQEALGIAQQLMDVLEYLHRQPSPVIFRDLKPSNVMCTPEGDVVLIDFGIARFFRQGKSEDTALLGTPGYAAPEQYGGAGQSSIRTDVYSLGVLIHQMLSGYDPSKSASPFGIPDPRSLGATIPDHIAEVVLRATQLRPENRFPSVSAMRKALFTDTRRPYGETQQGSTEMLPGISTPTGSRPLPHLQINPWALLVLAGIGVVALVGGVFGYTIWQNMKPEPTLVPTIASSQIETARTPVAFPTKQRTEERPTETATYEPKPSPTLRPPSLETSEVDLGRSVQGRPLSVITVGYQNGADLVVVGSIQGDQELTRDLVVELVTYLSANPALVPQGAMYHLIPTINPDGNALDSRYNARQVDLNRNWGSNDWRSNAAVPGYPQGKAGSGGSEPFSEPETRALRGYLLELRQNSNSLQVVVLHSSVRRETGEVYPSGGESLGLAQTYADTANYSVQHAWAEYTTSGEAVTWCAETGIPAIDVVVPASDTPYSRVDGSDTLLMLTAEALQALVGQQQR